MNNLDVLITAALYQEDAALLERAHHSDAHVFSSAYNQRFQMLFCVPEKRKINRTSRRLIAAILAATLLIGSATAFFPTFSAFFIQYFEKYAVMSISPTNSSSRTFIRLPSDWTSVWIPSQLPDGYALSEAYSLRHTKWLTYTSESGDTISFSQVDGSIFTYSDIESDVIKTIAISGFTAFACEKYFDGELAQLLKWSDGTSIFTLRGSIGYDALLDIGEHIELTEIGE